MIEITSTLNTPEASEDGLEQLDVALQPALLLRLRHLLDEEKLRKRRVKAIDFEFLSVQTSRNVLFRLMQIANCQRTVITGLL